jgi:O-antigen/teichoic acid export membrane protein
MLMPTASGGGGRISNVFLVLAGLTRRARGLSWGVADQAVSSLSNFAVNIYIARLLGAEQYGTFSVIYVTYAFALNASRGLATDPLMVRFSHVDQRTWKRVVAGCTGTTVSVGLVLGAGVLVAGAFLGGRLGLAFVALAVILPGLLLQDGWRFAFFSAGRGAQAFLNDLIWLAVVIPALVGLQLAHVTNVFWSLIAWGGAATVAAAVGLVQAGVVPRVSHTWQWLSRHRDLGFRYMVEGTTYSTSSQLRTYGIGLLLGLASVGYVQAANTLMAAVVVLVNGTGLIFLPEATRIWRDSTEKLLRYCARISVAYTSLAALWGAFLLVGLPKGLGQALLGSIWHPTYPLVLPTAVAIMGFCVAAGAGTGLKGTGAARRSLRAAVMTSVLYVLLSLCGAAIGGALGAVVGSALAMWCGAFVYWWQFVVALRESERPVSQVALTG